MKRLTIFVSRGISNSCAAFCCAFHFERRFSGLQIHSSGNDADDREVPDRVIVSKPYRDVPPESPLRPVDPRVWLASHGSCPQADLVLGCTCTILAAGDCSM